MMLLGIMMGEIHIWEPPSLKQIYSKKQMQYSIANFGSVPYGHSIYGTIFRATPLDGCTDLRPISWDQSSGTPILYMERGNCHFAQKVLQA